MIGVGDINLPNLSFSLYVDQQAMFAGSAIESLIHMYALFWVFDIEYPSDAKILYTFVSAVLLQRSVTQYYSKYKMILNVLEKLKLF